MAGRKQHYIPQFLLRAFAKKRKKDQFQVRAHFADRSFITATDGIGAEREFYSIIAPDEETLDDRITSAETDYAALHQSLLVHEAVDSSAASRLLSHLTIRGAHTRDVVSHMARSAMEMMEPHVRDPDVFRREAGLDGPMPAGHFKEVIDKKYNELRLKAGRAFMSRYDFQMLSHRMARERFHDLWQETLRDTDIVANMMIAAMPQTVAEAQRNVLDKDFEPSQRVGSYLRLQWRAESYSGHPIILPDCVALGRTNKGIIAPSFFIGFEELEYIYFPVSSNKVIHGYRNEFFTIPPDSFNKLAVRSSWDLFISHPEMKESRIESEIGLGIREYMRSLLTGVFANLIS